MIVRCYFSCATCGHHHTLRIYVGANKYQEHTFACRNCDEPIEVGMNVDYQNVATQPVPIANCVLSDQEGSIVTLHPEMVVPDDLQGKDFAFPYLHEISRIRQEDPTFDEDMVKSSVPAEEAFAAWEKSGRLPPGIGHDWEFAKRVWSLFLKGQNKVCVDYIEREYAHYRFDEPPHPYEVIYAFCAKLGRRWAKNIYDALQEEWEKAGTINTDECSALRTFFLESFAFDFLTGTHTIVSEYMDRGCPARC